MCLTVAAGGAGRLQTMGVINDCAIYVWSLIFTNKRPLKRPFEDKAKPCGLGQNGQYSIGLLDQDVT